MRRAVISAATFSAAFLIALTAFPADAYSAQPSKAVLKEIEQFRKEQANLLISEIENFSLKLKALQSKGFREQAFSDLNGGSYKKEPPPKPENPTLPFLEKIMKRYVR